MMNNLIIENTSKQGLWRRISQGGITLFLWATWLYLIAPLLLPVANAVGIQLPLSDTVNVETIVILLSTVLIVIAVLIIWSELWARYNTFLHRREKINTTFLKIGIAALAKHFNVHPSELAIWQQTQLLIIHTSDHGVIRRVNV